MRIGVISHTTGGRGGIERTVELQVRGLRSLGHDVSVLSGPTLGSGWVARAASAGALALLPARRLRDTDVLLAHYPPAPQVARRSARPYVHFLHHPLRAVYPTAVQQARVRYRVWSSLGAALTSVDRAGVHRAERVAVPSRRVAMDVERLYGINARVLPIGIDLAQWKPGGGDRQGPLLFAGRPQEPYKRLDVAFEVARQLNRPLHIVGAARPRPVHGVDAVWRGYLTGEPLAECYRQASLLLFPSVHEDFGLVPLEAMACGLPVVGWDDGYGPSSTLAAGSGGVLVSAYDVQAFTNSVKSVLDDPRLYAALSTAGPRWVREHYSIDSHLAGLIELLTEAAAR